MLLMVWMCFFECVFFMVFDVDFVDDAGTLFEGWMYLMFLIDQDGPDFSFFGWTFCVGLDIG